eukprot:6842800-Pyramimonas_sp.AAC.1
MPSSLCPRLSRFTGNPRICSGTCDMAGASRSTSSPGSSASARASSAGSLLAQLELLLDVEDDDADGARAIASQAATL